MHKIYVDLCSLARMFENKHLHGKQVLLLNKKWICFIGCYISREFCHINTLFVNFSPIENICVRNARSGFLS